MVGAIAGLTLGFGVCAVHAQEADQEKRWDARFQATYIWQQKPSFRAAYSGPNSLLPDREKAYTFSSTAYFGWRPASDLEIWFNPEVVQGVAFSGLHGFGGFPNGEQQKVSGPNPTFYRSRLFLRKTWALDGEDLRMEGKANQFAMGTKRERLVLTAGNLAVTDVFDPNNYAHDARTQFMNWAFLTHGAFDFAADARGYSWGAALEYYRGEWAFRAGRFMQPAQSNGLALDKRIGRRYGDQVEVEHTHQLAGRPGQTRLLLFRNHARMGAFDDAIAIASAASAIPDLSAVRREQSKRGVAFAFEQEVRNDIGVFGRASRHDGRTETYAFTEIDQSVSAGVAIKGRAWSRAEDTLGMAMAVNGLSSAHQRYLAAGGLGAFLGDGALNYSRERIGEIYYSLRLARSAWLSLDYQRIIHPGYNRDRGPVSVTSARMHLEF
jgi:high affinity Mn2+ porin